MCFAQGHNTVTPPAVNLFYPQSNALSTKPLRWLESHWKRQLMCGMGGVEEGGGGGFFKQTRSVISIMVLHVGLSKRFCGLLLSSCCGYFRFFCLFVFLFIFIRYDVLFEDYRIFTKGFLYWSLLANLISGTRIPRRKCIHFLSAIIAKH